MSERDQQETAQQAGRGKAHQQQGGRREEGRGREQQRPQHRRQHRPVYVEDLREKLNRIRLEKEEQPGVSGPPPDPNYNFLKDPERDAEASAHHRYEKPIQPNNQHFHQNRRPDFRNRPFQKRPATIQPVNIKVQLSTSTGERSYVVDEESVLPEIRHVPDRHGRGGRPHNTRYYSNKNPQQQQQQQPYRQQQDQQPQQHQQRTQQYRQQHRQQDRPQSQRGRPRQSNKRFFKESGGDAAAGVVPVLDEENWDVPDTKALEVPEFKETEKERNVDDSKMQKGTTELMPPSEKPEGIKEAANANELESKDAQSKADVDITTSAEVISKPEELEQAVPLKEGNSAAAAGEKVSKAEALEQEDDSSATVTENITRSTDLVPTVDSQQKGGEVKPADETDLSKSIVIEATSTGAI